MTVMDAAPTPEELLAHADWLSRLARTLVGDAAAPDLVQDTFEVALTRPPRRDGPLRPWLAGVARNVARMRARAGARRARREESAAPAADAPSPEDLVTRVETQQLVARIVLELEEPFRSTLLLRYYEGLTAAAIADAQGVPAGTVRWRLKEAIGRVRAELDRHHDGDRRRWAVMLAPLAGATHGAATTVLVGGLVVKTALKIAAIVIVLFAVIVAGRELGWWGLTEPAPAATADVKKPAPPRPIATVASSSAPLAAAPAFRDDDPRGTLRLEGQVIDEASHAVGGARVAIDTVPPRVVESEADGSFGFDGLIARDYRLEATAGDGYAGPARLRLTPEHEPVILRLRPGGVLAVTVVEAGRGTPIAGAAVELRSTLTWQATTGADGTATLRGVGPAHAPLAVRAEGFAPAAVMTITSGDPRTPEQRTVALGRGAAVAGRVVDDDGQPVAGARVVAASASEPFPVIDPRRDGAVTGADGAFRLPVVAAGTYRLTASDARHAPATSPPLVLDGTHPREGVELVLAAGASVHGVVRDTAGKPVAAADVRVVAGGHVPWRPQRQAFTGADGRFAFTGLAPREVDVVAWHPIGASAIAAADLAASPDLELTLTLDVTGAIAGVVVDPAGAPIGDAQVVAEPIGRNDLQKKAEWEVRGVQEAVTDPGGGFRFAGLPPGDYRLRAARPGASEVALWLGDGMLARPGDTAVKLVLAGDGGIAGKVAFPDGRPALAFTVAVGPTNPAPFAGTDGAFTLDIAAGDHRIEIAGPGFLTRTLRDVHVDETKVTDLGTITVEPGRSISGRVVDAAGAPVAGAQVAAGRLLSGDGTQLYIASESIDARDTHTDEDGRFVLTGFGKAPITIQAGKDGVGRSATVRVPAGETSVVLDLALASTGSVAGVMTRDGKPLADTIVIANPVGAPASNFFTATGPDGSYALDALFPGTYAVYPMLGGGGSRPKEMYVRAVEIKAGVRSQISVDATPGPATVTITIVDEAGKPVTAAPVFLIQSAVDAPNMDALRDGSWMPPELLAGGTAAMYMRFAMGKPVTIAGVRGGRHTVCTVPFPVGDDVAKAARFNEDSGGLPMKCQPVDLGAQREVRVEVKVPTAWTLPPA